MNRVFGRLVRVGAIAVLMLSASTLQAISFTLQNCPSCYGAIFEGTATQSATQIADNAWHVALTMDLSAVNLAGVQYLSTIAIKVAGGNGVEVFPTSTSFTLTHSVQGNIKGSGQLYKNATVSNANCDVSGGSPQGFLCLSYANGTSPLKTGVAGLYTWAFDIDLIDGVTPGLDSGLIPIRGNWDPANGKLLSDVAHVPEGVAGELPILLSGLVSLIIWRKRASFRTLVG